MSKRTENSWAIGLVVALGIFGAGLSVMVVASVTKNIDLVTDNYYEKGLKHEKRIQTVNRTQALEEQVSVVSGEGVVALSFPSQFSPAMVEGEVLLYRPSDRRLDTVVPVQLDSVGRQQIPTGGLQRGLWKLQLSWSYRGVDYYTEEPLVLR
jgi:hypothetical protein